MKNESVEVIALGGVFLSVLAVMAVAAPERYMVKVPHGLALSEFRGYQEWQYVAASVTDEHLKVIAGNPATITAFKSGTPANGQVFPDGAVLSRVQWMRKPIAEFTATATVPGDLKEVEFMVKDSKRFPETHGWGYAGFTYDAATNTLEPLGTGAKCGAACHEAAAQKDYVFTEYSAR